MVRYSHPICADRSSSAYPLGPELSVLPNRQHDTAPTRCKYNAGYNPASQSPLPDSRLPALVPLHESGSLPVSCGPGHAHRDASYPILTHCLLTYERLDSSKCGGPRHQKSKCFFVCLHASIQHFPSKSDNCDPHKHPYAALIDVQDLGTEVSCI